MRWFLLESLLTERFNFLLDHFLKIQVSSPSLLFCRESHYHCFLLSHKHRLDVAWSRRRRRGQNGSVAGWTSLLSQASKKSLACFVLPPCLQVVAFCTSYVSPLYIEVTLVSLAEPAVPLNEGVLQGSGAHVGHGMPVHGHAGQPKLVDRTPAATLQAGSSSQDQPELLGVQPAVLNCQWPV